MLPAMFCLGLFSIGTAASKNAASVFITRFFGGVFGSAPVSNVSAALGDIWEAKARGTAVTFYAVAVVGGPTLGPVIGSALVVNPHLGWRWTEYIEAIWTFVIFGLCVFALPEMYGPVLLKFKAQRLRKETGNDKFYHPHENMKLDLKTMITKHFSRPLLMLTTEPMVTCIAFYASFVFALLYMTLEVFPIVFQEQRGYGPVVGSLPFIALFVGVLAALFINLANQPRYIRIAKAAGGRPVPEARLPPMVCASTTSLTLLIRCGELTFLGSRWHPVCYRLVLVWLDCCSQVPLDHSHDRSWFHRRRFQRHLPTMHQLPRRHVHPLCR
jgi:MFS family permease